MSNGAGKFSPFPKMHLYFYSRCNGNDMGKIYVEIQGGQVTPLAPSWGRPCPLVVEALGNCPVCRPLNPALFLDIVTFVVV